MSKPVFIDDIHQVFESRGNLHLLGGCTSGQTTAEGKDLSEHCLHLVIPFERAMEIFPKLVANLPELAKTKIEVTREEPQIEPDRSEIRQGNPMVFKLQKSS